MSLGGKAKSPGTSRKQMTRRMWDVLKFTFIHEHFPSSVHMARLAKMMGLPWVSEDNLDIFVITKLQYKEALFKFLYYFIGLFTLVTPMKKLETAKFQKNI